MESTVTVGKYNCDLVFPYLPKTIHMSYGIAITATVLWYYICSGIHFIITKGGDSWKITVSMLGTYVVLFAIQAGMLLVQAKYGKCNITLMGSILSAVLGFVVGLSTFLLVRFSSPTNLPFMSSQIEKFANMTLSGGIGKPPPPSVVKDPAVEDPVQKSSKMDDKDEFVCDLYKNGQLITSTISE